MDSAAFLLSFKLATLSTLILFILGVPFAWWLSTTRWRIKPLIETVVSMPLVLPPSVLGFYLLLVFGPTHWFGGWLHQQFGVQLAFSFTGLVIASLIFSFPFLVHPVLAAFRSFPVELIAASKVLGKSNAVFFMRVLLPNTKPALLSGTILAFAHTLGELGVVLMIGGNLPNQTRTASIAIFDAVEAGAFDQAHGNALLLLLISFSIICVLHLLGRYKA